MTGELKCEGKILLGSIPWDASEQLSQLCGKWLAYAPEENAIIVQPAEDTGCPPMLAVPCELISILDSMPAEMRRNAVGGEVRVRDSSGNRIRLVVGNGELKVVWPSQQGAGEETRVQEAGKSDPLAAVGSVEARVDGWARFAGSPAAAGEIRALVDQYGGLFPENEMPSECCQNVAFVQFRHAHFRPTELVSMLTRYSESPESLEADLVVTPACAGQGKFHLRIEQGHIMTTATR